MLVLHSLVDNKLTSNVPNWNNNLINVSSDVKLVNILSTTMVRKILFKNT